MAQIDAKSSKFLSKSSKMGPSGKKSTKFCSDWSKFLQDWLKTAKNCSNWKINRFFYGKSVSWQFGRRFWGSPTEENLAERWISNNFELARLSPASCESEKPWKSSFGSNSRRWSLNEPIFDSISHRNRIVHSNSFAFIIDFDHTPPSSSPPISIVFNFTQLRVFFFIFGLLWV